jgi:hypothetical protein
MILRQVLLAYGLTLTKREHLFELLEMPSVSHPAETKSRDRTMRLTP